MLEFSKGRPSQKGIIAWFSRALYYIRAPDSHDNGDGEDTFGLGRGGVCVWGGRAAFLTQLRRDFLNSCSHHRVLSALRGDRKAGAAPSY